MPWYSDKTPGSTHQIHILWTLHDLANLSQAIKPVVGSLCSCKSYVMTFRVQATLATLTNTLSMGAHTPSQGASNTSDSWPGTLGATSEASQARGVGQTQPGWGALVVTQGWRLAPRHIDEMARRSAQGARGGRHDAMACFLAKNTLTLAPCRTLIPYPTLHRPTTPCLVIPCSMYRAATGTGFQCYFLMIMAKQTRLSRAHS